MFTGDRFLCLVAVHVVFVAILCISLSNLFLRLQFVSYFWYTLQPIVISIENFVFLLRILYFDFRVSCFHQWFLFVGCVSDVSYESQEWRQAASQKKNNRVLRGKPLLYCKKIQ